MLSVASFSGSSFLQCVIIRVLEEMCFVLKGCHRLISAVERWITLSLESFVSINESSRPIEKGAARRLKTWEN